MDGWIVFVLKRKVVSTVDAYITRNMLNYRHIIQSKTITKKSENIIKSLYFKYRLGTEVNASENILDGPSSCLFSSLHVYGCL